MDLNSSPGPESKKPIAVEVTLALEKMTNGDHASKQLLQVKSNKPQYTNISNISAIYSK